MTGKQRPRNRAARETARSAEPPKRPPSPSARPPSRPSRPVARKARPPVYRLRRFPPLPWRLKAALALGWLAVAVAVLYFVPTWTGRLGLLVLATSAVPLLVVLVRDPSRRTR